MYRAPYSGRFSGHELQRHLVTTMGFVHDKAEEFALHFVLNQKLRENCNEHKANFVPCSEQIIKKNWFIPVIGIIKTRK